MPDSIKEQERAELHRTIWNIANDLRGSVDGWDFKQYVLGMLFYRYISENLAGYINAGEHDAGVVSFDYARMPNEVAEQAREDLVSTKGFFIQPSELFENVRRRAPKDENLNETLENVFRNIEASAQGFESEDDLFDDFDVNSNKLGGTVAGRNERLVKLMNGVGEMKLGDYKNNTIDAFGDAVFPILQHKILYEEDITMSNQLTEQQVLQQLCIPDFRHITKDKVMEFASMLQNMEPEVAKKALEQFPEFAKMTLEVMREYKGVLEKSLDDNLASSKQCFDIYNTVLNTLKTCVDKENLPFEEKKHYLDKMMEIARMAESKDTGNKKFNWGIIFAGAVAVIAVVGIGASLLGGNTNFKLPNSKI